MFQNAELELVAKWNEFVRQRGEPIDVSPDLTTVRVTDERFLRVFEDGSFVIQGNSSCPAGFRCAEHMPAIQVFDLRLQYAEAKQRLVSEQFYEARDQGLLEDARLLRDQVRHWRRRAAELRSEFESLPEVRAMRQEQREQRAREQQLELWHQTAAMEHRVKWSASQALQLDDCTPSPERSNA